SKIHEERLIGLLILVEQFKKGNEKEKKAIFDFYLRHTAHINNWDLVDLSAHQIVGAYLLDKEYSLLLRLARSKNIWERRIAIIATFFFIRSDLFEATFDIAQILLNDTNDLIHKAVGWMLREVGKRNQEKEEVFLKKHYKKMPRTMLRYATERFDDKKTI
ncbi:DNA alkylation repair protein, partial [Candidatus Roizmanbacteria bacterium]|nr:DNA alkylation repair protein [Candidatus Roizmanbacteria bacterium]